MCFFPYRVSPSSDLYHRGILELPCGSCPECLSARSNRWALRCVAEAKEHAENCCLCLTYDQYVRDSRGKIIGERLPDDMTVKVRDIQLFIKRLRIYLFRRDGKNVPIRYLASSEYGKKTHRPHYHVMIFGWCPEDCVPYKKSKRGNLIYRSCILEKLWKNGICTVDNKTITGASAAYCTKYSVKGNFRAENTFMLCSHNIGISTLISEFDGRGYFLNGVLLPVPRGVWDRVLKARYSYIPDCDYKYVNRDHPDYDYWNSCRDRFRYYRDVDEQYRKYLSFWKQYSSVLQSGRASVETRIRNLPEDKYHFYKLSALDCLQQRRLGIPVPAPGSSAGYRRWWRYRCSQENRAARVREVVTCAIPSRLNSASDTSLDLNRVLYGKNPFDHQKLFKKVSKKTLQIHFDML